jgi:hypothetical protein
MASLWCIPDTHRGRFQYAFMLFFLELNISHVIAFEEGKFGALSDSCYGLRVRLDDYDYLILHIGMIMILIKSW